MSPLRLFFVLLVFAALSCRGQIGVSTGKFTGADATLVRPGYYFQLSAFIPSLQFRLRSFRGSNMRLEVRPSFKWVWYNFKNDLVVSRDTNFTAFVPDPDPGHVYQHGFLKKSSMMKSSSFFVPVTFPLVTKNSRYFIFSPGIWAEYLLGGSFSRKFSSNGSPATATARFKDGQGFYGFRRFQYGVCASVQYKLITVYSVYSLVPLFKKDQSLHLQKFEAGLLLNFFWKKAPLYRTFAQ